MARLKRDSKETQNRLKTDSKQGVMAIFLRNLAGVYALGQDSCFAHVSESVLPRLNPAKEHEIYLLKKAEQPQLLSSIYFASTTEHTSVFRFVYDEKEARRFYPNTEDKHIVEKTTSFIASHTAVDAETNTVRIVSQNKEEVFQLSEKRLFLVSFSHGQPSIQVVPNGVAEVSVGERTKTSTFYRYRKEGEHEGLLDNLLVAEECSEEKHKVIERVPGKTKDADLLLSFLAAKEFQINLREELDRECRLRIPYGVCLLFSEKSSGCLMKTFCLENTRIKRITAAAFDITKTSFRLQRTRIEELFLSDIVAIRFFYESIEKTQELDIEKLSFGGFFCQKDRNASDIDRLLQQKDKNILKIIGWGCKRNPKKTSPKIKKLLLEKTNFFCFLEEAAKTGEREIHVEELSVAQRGEASAPETDTKIFVSKKLKIEGNIRVLLSIVLGPELNHLDFREVQRQCGWSRTKTPEINISLTKNKIFINETLYACKLLAKDITAATVGVFAGNGEDTLAGKRIKLGAEGLECICLRKGGLHFLLSIENEEIRARNMEVVNTKRTLFSEKEQEEVKKKKFVIGQRLYMRNSGVLFLLFLGEKNYIPEIEIEFDSYLQDWRCLRKGLGKRSLGENYVETNFFLMVYAGPNMGGIENLIEKIIRQKRIVLGTVSGHPTLVFDQEPCLSEDIEELEDKYNTLGCLFDF
ncbi:MAG: uncharacterized protein A8A55_0769 [Amphiamblys sp. WSBS2006]|nr:MAG: uncharacterized protein A8A55_0769 [Amphiamblys sp. WSBS2006]